MKTWSYFRKEFFKPRILHKERQISFQYINFEVCLFSLNIINKAANIKAHHFSLLQEIKCLVFFFKPRAKNAKQLSPRDKAKAASTWIGRLSCEQTLNNPPCHGLHSALPFMSASHFGHATNFPFTITFSNRRQERQTLKSQGSGRHWFFIYRCWKSLSNLKAEL